jgi:hypothetical protein
MSTAAARGETEGEDVAMNKQPEKRKGQRRILLGRINAYGFSNVAALCHEQSEMQCFLCCI